MPSLPFPLLPLLLLSAALLPTLVEAGDEQGVAVVDRQMESERPLLSTNALTPFHDAPLIVSKEERQARKLLRKKKKRLRELREEIRRMGKVNGGMHTGKLARSRDDKWRRRLLSRLDTITSRLDRLETLIINSSPRSTIKHKEAVKDEKKEEMDRHFASVSRSLNGEAGMACASHRDCRPGRCCHAAAAPAAAAAAGVCVRHDAAAAVGCADSCQCTAQLLCFAPKHNSANNATQPACKRAASTDIVTGTYLNDPDAIF